MKDLFTGHHVGQSRPLRLSDDVVSTATYGGEDNCYRYTLRRVWEEGRPMVMWLMMNPQSPPSMEMTGPWPNASVTRGHGGMVGCLWATPLPTAAPTRPGCWKHQTP